MKCFLLAAGYGSRLGKLTKETAKCLLPVGNKNMLGHWFYNLKLYGVKEVLVNTHHCSEKVVAACAPFLQEGFKITFTYEKNLLGTARTIVENKDFVANERYFLIAYTDTWMRVDLASMHAFQKKRRGLGSLGLYRPVNFIDQGCVKVDGRKIVKIEEKPNKPDGKHAFAGIMMGSYAMFKYFKEDMVDLVTDWLPEIKDGLNPYFIDGHVFDIGTPDRYEMACKQVSSMGLLSL